MLKVRVTFENDKPEEVKDLIRSLEEQGYKILNQSNIYKGRGKSCYDNIYLDVRKEERG